MPSSEPLPSEVYEILSERGDGPVLMLNLLEFNPGGAELYADYGRQTAPLLEKARGRVLVSAAPAQTLIGEGHWDLVLVVEYESPKLLLALLGSPEYRAAEDLRTLAVKRSELRAMDPVGDAWR